MTEKNRFYAGAATALALAVALGFGIAQLTGSDAPAPEAPAKAEAAPSNEVVISADGISLSQIGVAPAAGGELDAAIPAAATVETTPDAVAVLTARAPGTVTRIFKRIGDPVRAGETLALVESRDASTIATDRDHAHARERLAPRQLEREKKLLGQGVSPRADYEIADAHLAVALAARKSSRLNYRQQSAT